MPGRGSAAFCGVMALWAVLRMLCAPALCAVLFVGGTPALCALAVDAGEAAKEEELLRGLTESERQEFLKELYSDMEEGGGSEPAVGLEEELSDEEAARLLQENLPDQDELEEFVERAGERVMALSPFRSGHDAERKLYRYTFTEDTGRVSLSVPLGAWTEYAVVLLPENGARINHLYRDGEEVTDMPGADGAWLFRETGRYSFYACGSQKGGTYLAGSFRIVSMQAPVSDSFLWSPEGYRLLSAEVDGRELEVEDGRFCPLPGDGRYHLVYAAKSAGLPQDYECVFLRDTTPPAITWEGEIHGGKFSGEVRYAVSDPDAEVAIYFNGQPAYTETGSLAAAGSYFVTATDKSGNMRSWQFVVERRGEIPWPLLGIAAAAALAAGILLIATAARGMRVR